MIRTEAPTTYPYRWDMSTTGQCTWYAYFRAIEESGLSPCWHTGIHTKGYGYYRDAKYWLIHPRTPWQSITSKSYVPVAGDIVVFDGQYGHVSYIEKMNSDGTCLLSNYNRYRDGKQYKEFYLIDNWAKGTPLAGTTAVLGYLHLDLEHSIISSEEAINKMAEDVISGMYGNGSERPKALYKAIQSRVNEILGG